MGREGWRLERRGGDRKGGVHGEYLCHLHQTAETCNF